MDEANKNKIRDDIKVLTTEEERLKKEAQDAEDKKNRGNYRCSRCNLPKKGHVCPYQQKFKRRDQLFVEGPPVVSLSKDSDCQVEMDFELTVRQLGSLDKQGFPESYEPVILPTIVSRLHEASL